jgi:hypothetical protein
MVKVKYTKEFLNNVGFYNLYKVSKTGEVYSLKYKKNMTLEETINGYISVRVRSAPLNCHILIHRLVALTYIDNPENKPCVDHIDHNRKNNNVSNLR